ncbi:hypothetical protein [Demequina mangrovi]|uniref:Uncharacterized protein n=1 Tax=Demequina mangrovi TaxID=1043493 RepID=A0A1H6X4I1_9MICO|nr:hypothetical protein [Demequina mangrovi]SEJ24071.1 hypothetical protein SAMN05421637_1286 [Demequina mangrovi]
MRRRGWAIAAGAAGLALALVFVKASLAWSDAQPYDPAVTEPRYIVLILISLAIAGAGLLAAIRLWTGPWRGRQDRRR